MGIIKSLRLGNRLNKRGFQTIEDLDRIIEGHGGVNTYAGPSVSETTAINYSAVFDAVWIISNTIASLPLILYQRVGESGKKRYQRSELYNLLHNQPNSEMTSYIWREISQAHLLLWGNAYSQIIRTKGDEIDSLWPLNPQRVQVKRENGRLIYVFKDTNHREHIFKPEQILHIPGFGFDGRVGKSVISIARQSIGLGLATEEFGARFFGNGANTEIVLKHPGRFSEKSGAIDRIRKQWEEKYQGLSNAHKPFILEEGMDIDKLTIPPDDAQFLETRKFQVDEIARWFHIPPHKLKELSRSTYTNIEHQQIEYVTDTIRPWLVRWENHLNWKLLDVNERKTYFTEFLMDALLRGDTATRYQAYATARQNGIMNADEWRAKENMNPIKDKEVGGMYWMPLNMTDASQAGEVEPIEGKPFEGEPEEEKPKEEKPKEEEPEKKNLEKRLLAKGLKREAIRSIQLRRRYAGRYKKLFREVTNTIIAKERDAVMKIAHKSYDERSLLDFKEAIDEWYAKNKAKIRQSFSAPINSYADAIMEVAIGETGMDGIDAKETQDYVEGYVDITTDRYVNSSRGQLKSEARKAEEDERDPIEAIDKRLVEWEEKRPDKVADREVVDGECAFSQHVYWAAGLQSRWVTIGDNCPYCDSLDGMAIGRGGNYFHKGDVLEPFGATHGPLLMSSNVSHPALHAGCDCTIIAM